MTSEAIPRELPHAGTGSRVQGEPGKDHGKLEGELAKELAEIDALWRAANYLSVGQIAAARGGDRSAA